MNNDERVTKSSGNVFADLGLPDAAELDTKSRLVAIILQTAAERKWTQKQTAEALGVRQPDVSDLKRGRLTKFSIERLLAFVARLDHEITLVISRENRPDERIALPAHRAS